MSVVEQINRRSPDGPAPHPIDAGASSRVTVIESQQGFAGLNVSELWSYRDLLITLASRDVKLRYRQTSVGVLWVVFQPLLSSLILAFVFTVLAKVDTGGVPAIPFVLAGNIGFMVFSSTLTKANMSLVNNANLVSKIYFPRLILPLSTAFSSLIDFGVGLGLVFVFLLAFRLLPTLALFLLPLWVLILLTMSIGIGLFVGALTVSYRDVQYVTPVFVQLLTFATPIGWSLATLHVPHWAHLLVSLNPLTGLMDAMRWSLLGPKMPPPSGFSLLYAALFAVAVLLGGAFSFRNMERRFADVI